MPNRASAVESISPAFARTKQMLFQPFRFGLWARLAVVALVTGEAGSVGGGSSIPNLNNNRGGGDQLAGATRLFSLPGWDQMQAYAGWIALGLAVGLAVLLLWIYSDCVYRFILLDAVVSGQCRLREGWRRWREAGRRYFVWVIAFGFGAFAAVGVVAGIPALLAYRAGWFDKPEENLGVLIGGGILLALLVIAMVAVLAVIDMLARDFLVPVMAFENVGAVEGWERLLAMMGAEKSAYAVYVLMKIVLAIGSGIIFAIVNLIVILVLLIPLGLLALVGYFIGTGLGITWDLSMELLVGAFGSLALAGILYVVGFVYAPGLVFFQSYTVEFFAPRYGPLGNKMFSPTPAVPRLPPHSGPMPPVPPLVPGDAFPS
jgi:hypothetical protein